MDELVSVIIPVYNAAEFVKASVESILLQTYSNLEIIIVNDGSTDHSAEILNEFSDSRIKLIHQENSGVAKALNTALGNVSGKYIARQDADDISMPDRIKLQVDFLEKNTEYGLLGAQARIIDAKKIPHGFLNHATGNVKLKYDLLWDSCFVSSTTIFRKDCLSKTGNFYSGKDLFEDYNMWSAISCYYKIANLPDILLDYRELSTGLSFTTTNSFDRIFNQRKKNISTKFPLMDKNLVEALAFCGKKRTHVSSLSQIRKVYEMIVRHFESIGATKEEMTEIRTDLAERMHTFRWMTGENKNIFYYPGRILEKLAYPR
ncbi:MAG TPA: glycosyltransferase family 2 protein [Bacteroidia bacterium]|nr:glycosyltransferase family 2 protein [Bacteroidia bacterium]